MHSHSTNVFPEDIEDTTNPTPVPPQRSLIKSLSFLDRFLALWIFLAMVLGILLGCFVPGTHQVLQAATLIGVSAPIGMSFIFPTHFLLAVGLIVMMYPILCKVRFEELGLILKKRSLWTQLGFSFIVNWIIAPLVMVQHILFK